MKATPARLDLAPKDKTKVAASRFPKKKSKQGTKGARVKALARELLADPEGWLDAPNPRLNGRRPIDLIGTKDERHVKNMLEAFKYGLF